VIRNNGHGEEQWDAILERLQGLGRPGLPGGVPERSRPRSGGRQAGSQTEPDGSNCPDRLDELNGLDPLNGLDDRDVLHGLNGSEDRDVLHGMNGSEDRDELNGPEGLKGLDHANFLADRKLTEIYLPLVQTTALVIAQLGQTLDGRIATRTGHSHFVTGPEDIRHLHRLRALVDAVVVGAGTVVADDPQLTVRKVRGVNPVRVVLDPSGRVSPQARLFRDRSAPTLWIRSPRAPAIRASKPVEGLILDEETPGQGFRPADVITLLAERGLHRILVEGGGITVSRFLAAGVLDRFHLTVAPLLLGSGRGSVTLAPVDTLDRALRPQCRHFALGRDMLFDLCLRP